MKLDYDVTLHLEVLHEGFSELLSEIRHLEDALHIDMMDQNEPLAEFEKHVATVYHGIFGANYNTMDDVQQLTQQLDDARAYLREMEVRGARQLERAGA